MIRAFTLAEVLITLGIIGIVAAMTMPILIGNYQKKATVSKLKKAYTVLSQLVVKSQADNGPASFSTEDEVNADSVKSFFDTYWLPYFNTPIVSSNGVLPYKVGYAYKTISGKKYETSIATVYSTGRIFFTTGDGISFFIYMMTWDNQYDEDGNLVSQIPRYNSQQHVFVDIDGVKGKNTIGKDVFRFVVDFDGNVVRPLYYANSYSFVNNNCITTGYACAAKIMADGWEIKDDYPW